MIPGDGQSAEAALSSLMAASTSSRSGFAIDASEKYQRSAASHSSWVSSSTASARRLRAASVGKMPTTLHLRFSSLFSHSSTTVDLPGWRVVAEHFDGVHVTDGYSPLAGWDPDATLWLNDVIEATERVGEWEGPFNFAAEEQR